MIRILHFVSSTYRGSGVMHFIMNYYKKIDRNILQFDFIAFEKSDNNYDEEIKKLGGNIFYIAKPSINMKFIIDINKVLNNKKYEIYHCHPIYSFLLIGIFKKKYHIKNIIQHSHTNRLSANKISGIRNYFLLKLSPLFVDKYCACSKEALTLFSTKDLKKKGYKIIENAVEYSKYKFNETKRELIRKKYNINNYDIVIGHVGRFSKEKNHELIINAFEKLLKLNDNYKLLLLGDGILKEDIIELSKSKKIDCRIIFAGNVSNVEDYLSAMDLFLFPSSFEGFGLALLEAQLNGLKCISSKYIPEDVIITNNVIRCNISLDSIVNQIKEMRINNKNRMYTICINKYDIDNTKNKLIEFYKSLISWD